MKAARAAREGTGPTRLLRVLIILSLAKAAVIVAAGLMPLGSPGARAPIGATVILDRRGDVLAFDQATGLRIAVPLEAVSPVMVAATVAAEDEWFFAHDGVDPGAVIRSLVSLPVQRSGGSTITQQLARQLYLEPGESVLVRKPAEAIVAIGLETRFDKPTILEAYLNTAYYGRGAHGIEAAARLYFGVPAANLDLAQASLLAGLPRAPSLLDPLSDMPRARARQRYVLDRMVVTGQVRADEAEAAAARELVLRGEPDRPVAPHFLDYVREELARVRPDLAGVPGLVIETTLDARLQAEAEAAVRRQLERLASRGDAPDGAAVAVLDPRSGQVLVMVGSPSYYAARAGQVNAATALRQPGSAIKPFLYAAALGNGYTAASPLLDIPASLTVPEGVYSPENFDRQFRGIVPLRVALASSLNVPAVRVLEALGLETFVRALNDLGLGPQGSGIHGPALALGTSEVSLLGLTSAYATLASLGERVSPYAITRVSANDGTVLYAPPPPPATRVIDPGVAWLIGDILSDPFARTPGFGRPAAFDLPFQAAVKTGTTTGFRDNWAIGYTPARVVGAWVGNADGSEMDGTSGVEGAAPIWHDVLLSAMEGVPATWPPAPETLVREHICSPTGLLPGAACPAITEEWFLAGTEPRDRERYYERGADGRLVIHPPLAAEGWLRAAGWSVAEPRAASTSIAVLSPADGTVFALAPELIQAGVLVRVAVTPGVSELRITIDGEALLRAGGDPKTAVWRPSEGVHVLEVSGIGPDGNTLMATARYEVRRQ